MTYLAVFICGILTALPLVFDFLLFLPWFTVAPLLVIITKKKSAYRHGFVFSLGYYAVVYYWFTYLYPLEFAGFSNTASVLIIITAWVGMSVMQSVGTAFVPFVLRRFRGSKCFLVLPFAAASMWCLMEWAQNLFWFGVPWARLALTQSTSLPMLQSASLFGSLFIGFLIVLVNGLLAEAYFFFVENKEKIFRGRIHISAYIAVGIVILNFAFGEIRLLTFDKNGEESFVAAAIQGNIPSGDKWADDSLSNSMKIYTGLTEKAVSESGAKLVVWPETVITVSLNRSASLQKQIGKLAKENGVYIALGAFYDGENREDPENEEEISCNSIYLFSPDGQMSETVYNKRHLVPFGEYLPMPKVIKTLLPFLAEVNMFSDDLTAGKTSALFETEFGKIGALVCFDSIYEELALSSVRDGAELMVLSTNDSWYLDSAACRQHNCHAVLRAIENGRCFVRAANTGISSVISGTGEIKASLGALKTGYTYAEVYTSSGRTVYSCVGDIIVWLSAGYVIVGVICLAVNRKRKSADSTVSELKSDS